MRNLTHFLLAWLSIVCILAQPALVHAQTRAPGTTPQPAATATAAVLDAQVDALLAQMSPADRVGQLFVVTFTGNATDFESDIVELIHGYRVGGVVISARNGNFTNGKGTDTPRTVATLVNQLQGMAYGLLLPPAQALAPMPIAPWPPRSLTYLPAETGAPASNLPLLIGVDQAGDDLPGTALRRGFTALPSQMAVGAGWTPPLATQVGAVVGRELAAVGINLLLGPTLDVFDQTDIDQVGSLGTFAFGGDPFWVSQLGRAYITGVHAGGDGRVATVARHFPGQGNADRLPDEEVATIQKSLDELQRVALPPFVSVTRQPSSIVDPQGDPGATDLLMTSHMRYSGIQGGAGARGAPLSLSPELRTFLTQQGFEPWRAAGGLLMSNALGVPAVRRFYNSATQDFFHRRAALDAFLAGNDLLYLADFSQDGEWESAKANIKAVIGFFQDRYNNDPDFANRVDEAVRRILQLKLGLYRSAIADPSSPAAATGSAPLIPLSNVMVSESDLRTLSGGARAQADLVMGEAARNAVTILFPDPATQTEPLPPPFQVDDDILIFSDSRLVRECAECTAEAAIGPDEVANIIKRLYGAEATGQIDPDRVTSLTFVDLNMFLDNQRKAAEEREASTVGPRTASVSISPTVAITLPAMLTSFDLEALVSGVPAALFQDRNAKTANVIKDADWIIFAMLDVNPARYPNSDAVVRFLREYGDDLADQKLVVLALNAPYFLDATEMSRLTTYLGVYSKTQPFLESAVRALFSAYTPVGAPPVDVPGTRFSSLSSRVAPDPARVMPLAVVDTADQLVAQNTVAAPDNAAAQPTGIELGETLRLQVGPVLDRNGHLVPDGVSVAFQLGYEGEELALAVAPALTRAGLAEREITVERAGQLRVAATAGEATTGNPLFVTIAPPPTPTPGPESATTATEPDPEKTGRRTSLLALLLALSTLLVTLSLFLIVQVRILPRTTLVHNLLWAAIFGLVGYVLYGLGLLPGSQWLQANLGAWGVPLVVFVPMLLPLLWLQLRSESAVGR